MLQAEQHAGRGNAPEAATLPLAVTRLTLTDFRNYAAERIEVAPRPVVLTGANGAGKTNVLEALSYLTPGRGLRGVRLPELSRIGGAGGWSVAARIETPSGSAAVGTGIEGRTADDGDDGVEDGGAERRVVRIDGAPARGPAALADLIRVVWLTPQMDRLFTDGRSDRRRFLDRLVLGYDPEHGRRVGAYERVMRERLKLLRDGSSDDSWLTALEGRMAEATVAIAAARREAVMRLRGALAAGIGPFPRAELTVRGLAEDLLAEHAAVEVEGRLQALLRRNRTADRDAGRTQEGAHRADLEVVHVVKGLPAALCSTGEQKALLVAVVLADARLQAVHRGAPPLLLLDEVAAHLDETRREALFDEILALGSQAWMTGTDRALFERLTGKALFLGVAQGKVTDG